MDIRKLNDDIWSEILSYLDLKSIFILEQTDVIFEEILERTRYWERQIQKKFSHFQFDISERGAENYYYTIRNVYWNLYSLNHVCNNICKLCLIDDICMDIPNCKKCDWLNYLD